jgi:hypothetical protein
MRELIEIFPFAFGVLLGLTWQRFGGPRAWRVRWGAACIVLGASATFASGEWRESPLYFLFDIGLVAFMSIATALADDTVVLIDCPVDYAENMRLTARLNEMTAPV